MLAQQEEPVSHKSLLPAAVPFASHSDLLCSVCTDQTLAAQPDRACAHWRRSPAPEFAYGQPAAIEWVW